LVTHPEADHIGGLPEILRKFEVGVVVYPAEFSISTSSIWQEVKNLAATRGVPLVGVLRGGEVRVPGLQMQALWPVRGCIAELPTNECALVMRARLINADFLFTGDIGLRGERALLAVGGNGELRADVLKIPHHGSKNSILPQFFSAVSSSFAVVQAGANNTYGHASPELLRRLSAFVGHLWSTAQEGGVEVIPSNDPQGIRISSWE
jgi:competence protein ComEC